jgi:glucose dehydrogenase
LKIDQAGEKLSSHSQEGLMALRKLMFMMMAVLTLAVVLPANAQQGPSKFSGQSKYDNVTLKSGTSSDNSLNQWHSDVLKSQSKLRTDHGAGTNSLKSRTSDQVRKGDQGKTGGGTTWGWSSYDPPVGTTYYGNGNPSPWHPDSPSRGTTRTCRGC